MSLKIGFRRRNLDVVPCPIVPIIRHMPLLRTEIEGPGATASPTELQRILKLQVPVIVKLAERKIALSEVLRLGVGAIMEFSKSSNEPLELMVNNKTIGIGETVKVGENFGLRITQMGDIKRIIASLAAHR